MQVLFCASDSYKEYDEKVEKLAKRLMDIIIEGLEVDSSHFEKYLEHSRGLLRWNHYPACPEPHKTLGLTPHTDFNLLTVLHHGDIGGLQVEKAGEWIAVRPRPDALAINIGDTFQVTNKCHGKNHAPLHHNLNKLPLKVQLVPEAVHRECNSLTCIGLN